MDPFVPALEELSQALTAGEDPEQALAEIAEDHGLAAHALRNRAVRAFGPLETYKERQAALKQERQRSALRSDPASGRSLVLGGGGKPQPHAVARGVGRTGPALGPRVWG